DLIVFGDGHEIAITLIEQLEQIMLNLDVIVRPRETESRGGLQRATRGGIELADEGSQIDSHAASCASERVSIVSSGSRVMGAVPSQVVQPSGRASSSASPSAQGCTSSRARTSWISTSSWSPTKNFASATSVFHPLPVGSRPSY